MRAVAWLRSFLVVRDRLLSLFFLEARDRLRARSVLGVLHGQARPCFGPAALFQLPTRSLLGLLSRLGVLDGLRPLLLLASRRLRGPLFLLQGGGWLWSLSSLGVVDRCFLRALCLLRLLDWLWVLSVGVWDQLSLLFPLALPAGLWLLARLGVPLRVRLLARLWVLWWRKLFTLLGVLDALGLRVLLGVLDRLRLRVMLEGLAWLGPLVPPDTAAWL